MTKKLFISLFLFLFVFSLGIIATEKDKANTIELLVWEEMGRDQPWILLWYPEEPYNLTDFDTGPFMVKHVPPSPKGEMLFFAVQLIGHFSKLSAATEFRYACFNRWYIYSDVIPSNVEVFLYVTLCYCIPENQTVVGGRQLRYAKVSMRRNSVDWWEVRYKDTNEMLPKEESISILNNLIDNGFDVEFSCEGWVQGVERVRIAPFWIEITRVLK